MFFAWTYYKNNQSHKSDPLLQIFWFFIWQNINTYMATFASPYETSLHINHHEQQHASCEPSLSTIQTITWKFLKKRVPKPFFWHAQNCLTCCNQNIPERNNTVLLPIQAAEPTYTVKICDMSGSGCPLLSLTSKCMAPPVDGFLWFRIWNCTSSDKT